MHCLKLKQTSCSDNLFCERSNPQPYNGYQSHTTFSAELSSVLVDVNHLRLLTWTVFNIYKKKGLTIAAVHS